jgi:hypothetical protein
VNNQSDKAQVATCWSGAKNDMDHTWMNISKTMIFLIFLLMDLLRGIAWGSADLILRQAQSLS